MKLVIWGVVAFIVPIFLLYQVIVDAVGVALAMTLIMVITGFLFSSVAAYMAGLVGSSNNPISGITIATILFTSLLLVWLMGGDDAGRGRNGILFASGLITGEALIGILIAVPIVVSGNPDVLAVAAELPAIVGFLVIADLVAYLYRAATRD